MRKRAFCRLCHGRCSIVVEVVGGKATKVYGDPQPPTPNRGSVCLKALAIPSVLNHPKRITHPLVRVGERGEGKWKRVSMGEALDLVAEKLQEIREKYGPRSLLICVGYPKALELSFAQRFASVYGTPNVASDGDVCHMPREMAEHLTYGSIAMPDEESPPKLMVVWGCNPHETRSATLRLPQIESFVKRGARVVVVDPRKTPLASEAEKWVRLKPGSDCWLAIGLLKVIVKEKLYDEKFVEKWVVGFDELREHLRAFSMKEVERQTWVPKSEMEEVAKLYATNKPSVILWGNAIDHIPDALQAARAICILRALTGNLDRPGGELVLKRLPIRRPSEFLLLKELPRKQSVGEEYVLATRNAFIPRYAAIKAIIEQKPYPIKAAIVIGTNPLITYQNSKRVYEAFMKLELLVVLELFMTPTAYIADVVLPVSYALEHDEISPYPAFSGEIIANPKVVNPPGECLPDAQILCELAKRMGFGEYFWSDYRAAIDYILEPAGISFSQLLEIRVLRAERRYWRYLDEGFRTPSGKVEVYSKRLENMGIAPLPTPFPTAELTEEYPFLLTSYKPLPYVHSSLRNVAELRRMRPEPVVEMHPSPAEKLGLREGDWVVVETELGGAKLKLMLNKDVDQRVVFADYGWWLVEDPTQYEVHNINVLIPDEALAETGLGTTRLRGVPCRVSKA